MVFMALLVGCGGGGGGSVDVVQQDPDKVGAGWITMTVPVSTGAYSTGSSTVSLGGEAFISPTWKRCCSGDATDSGVSVSWTNAATGASGPAYQSVTYSCLPFVGCFLNTHSWSATIELAFGDNLITVTAADPSGNLARTRITVTRTPDNVPPTVSSTSPANGASNVATNTSLQIVFSEAMDSATLNPFNILLKDSSDNAVSGSVSYANGTASFTPAAALSSSTLYTAAVTTGVKDIAGNPLATAYLWSFTTGTAPDQTAPSVVAKSPDEGGTCVPTETDIAAQFSEQIAPETLNTSTFLLRDASNAPVGGTVALGIANTGHFQPSFPLADSATYTALLTTGVKDLAGNPLASLSWAFSTQPAGSGLWSTASTTGAPSPRSGHTAVWTGTRMIVWGGDLGDGGRYDPVADAWSPVSNTGAPESRMGHVAVMAGSKMIIWGGVRPGAYLNSGTLYDPATDTWSLMTTVGAPSPRHRATAVWTGSEMLVWGGSNGTGDLNDGARYNPATDTWTPIAVSGAPTARSGHTAVWTGSSMLVWGGVGPLGPFLETGGSYTPASDSWVSIPLANAPSARTDHTAVWTGQELLVWGGRDNAQALGTGGRFNPANNTWQPMAGLCAPLARYGHVGVWTGSEFLVWGGGLANGPHYSVGGRYNPGTNTWQAIPRIGAPGSRMGHTGVWDGSGLILWGGHDALATRLNNGGRYQPQ